jgi:putative SOS response-associated peptidase YedK
MPLDVAPSYRQAFAKRRCLIPADGFYEWRKTAKPKLPFAIAMKDGRPLIQIGSVKSGPTFMRLGFAIVWLKQIRPI